MAKYKHILIILLGLLSSAIIAASFGHVSLAQDSNLRWSGNRVTGTITMPGASSPVSSDVTFTGSGPTLTSNDTVSFSRSSTTGSGNHQTTVSCEARPSLTVTDHSAGTLQLEVTSGPNSCNEVAGNREVSISGTAPDSFGFGEAPEDEDAEEDMNTCMIEGTGWFICGLATTMAQAMDGIYGLLESMLVIPNLNTDISNNGEGNSMYSAWQAIRNIANLAFIIAFLIIIFSHVTSVGLSNYSIKKMLPRLVIAAILVNTSYWISAIAVDASNIIGNSIYDLLQDIRTGSLDEPMPNDSWTNLIGALMTGTGVVLTAALIVSPAGTATALMAAFWIAWPALAGALLAGIVAIAAIAIRHALVVILIVLSPLAFVAFLLPNTERLFNTWRKLLTTMLVFHPIVAIIFAGSQLTSVLILQTLVDREGVGHLVALALFIQVAPLIMLPTIMTIGGGLVAKLAGSMTNKGKSALGRFGSFAKEQRELNHGNFMRKNPNNRGERFLQRAAGFRGNRRMSRQARLESNRNLAKARWHDSQGGRKADVETARAEEELKRASSESAAAAERAIPIDLKFKARSADIDKQSAEAATEQGWQEFMAAANYQGDKSNSIFEGMSEDEFKTLQRRALSSQAALDDYTSAATLAKNEQTTLRAAAIAGDDEIAKRLAGEDASAAYLAARAGGNVDRRGVSKAVASATATLNAKESEEVKASRGSMDEAGLSVEEKKEVALGGRVVKKTEDGRTFVFDGSGKHGEIERLAATEEFMAGSPTSMKREFMNNVNAMSATQRKVASNAFEASGAGAALPHLAGRGGEDIRQGRVVKVGKDGKLEYSEAQKEIIENEKHLPDDQKTKFLTEQDLMRRYVEEENKFGEKQAANMHHSAVSVLQQVMPTLSPQKQASVIASIGKAEANPNLTIDPKAQAKYDDLRSIKVSPEVTANVSQPQVKVESGDFSVGNLKISGAQPLADSPAGGVLKVQHDSAPKSQSAQGSQSTQYTSNQDIRTNYNVTNYTSNYMPADQRMRTSPPAGTGSYQQADSGLYVPPPPRQPTPAPQPQPAAPQQTPPPAQPQPQSPPPSGNIYEKYPGLAPQTPPTDSMGGKFLK